MSDYLDEGYIKFDIDWKESDSPASSSTSELKLYRDKMYQLGLIGFYQKHNVGYGNISVKSENGIVISGTQTGHLSTLENQHFTLVDSYDINKNSLHCKGKIKASSESLTHAAIYECDNQIKAVIHIHHKELWERALNRIPTSSKNVPYGTPEMANEIFRLYKDTSFSSEKILVMAGHDEGIIAFGSSLKEANDIIIKHYKQFALSKTN